MLYDIRLALHYDYDAPVQGGRHLVRVTPISVPGVQRVIASSLHCDPAPVSRTQFSDFFGNAVTAIVFSHAHRTLDIALTARVLVEDLITPVDLSPGLAGLAADLMRNWSLGPESPHHFLAPSPRVSLDAAMTAYGAASAARTPSVLAAALDLCLTIHRDFDYDPEATDVGTSPDEAFALRRGVCQDFAHVMIAALRGVGIPAAYVSGFLRTNPPPGEARLEGADAMHAWVRVWCGADTGWVEFDPTNAMIAGPDHISIGYGRDYADVSPIVGVLKTHGSHKTRQAVDVVRIA